MFLKVLFVIILIIYILRLLSPYIMRWIIRRMEKKITEQFKNISNQQQNQQQKKSAGDITINKTDKKKKKVDKNIGDYIDFEEEH